jgi:hypothetical protein
MKTIDAVLEKARKPGGPRAIPEEMKPVLVDLYRHGHGYHATACILRSSHGLNAHYSSARKTLIRLGEVRRK